MRINKKFTLFIVCFLFLLINIQSSFVHSKNKTLSLSHQVYNFLTTWLIEQNEKQALEFLSLSPVACFSADDNKQSHDEIQQLFKEVLSQAIMELGKRHSLAESIEPFDLPKGKYTKTSHQWKESFVLVPLPKKEIETYLCTNDLSSLSKHGVDTKNLYLVIFTFKVPEDKKGGLILVWAREREQWRIISFDAISF